MAKSKKSTTTETKDLTTLRDMDRVSLLAELHDARKSLFVLQMKHSLGELKQPHLLTRARKYVAQVSTFLTAAV